MVQMILFKRRLRNSISINFSKIMPGGPPNIVLSAKINRFFLNLVLGPPKNVTLSLIDYNQSRLTWEAPECSRETTIEYTIFYTYNGIKWMEINTTDHGVMIPFDGQSLYAAVASMLKLEADLSEIHLVNYSKIVTLDEASLRKFIRIPKCILIYKISRVINLL